MDGGSQQCSFASSLPHRSISRSPNAAASISIMDWTKRTLLSIATGGGAHQSDSEARHKIRALLHAHSCGDADHEWRFLEESIIGLITSELSYKGSADEAVTVATRLSSSFRVVSLDELQLSIRGEASHVPHRYAITSTRDAIYVGFAGTTSIADLIVDSKFGMAELRAWVGSLGVVSVGMVHSGFLAVARRVPYRHLYELAQTQHKRLVFTGHSLGGGIAMLCVLLLLLELTRHEPHPLRDQTSVSSSTRRASVAPSSTAAEAASSSTSSTSSSASRPLSPLDIESMQRIGLSCVTFGQPMVGNAKLQEFVSAKRWDSYFKVYFGPTDFIPKILAVPPLQLTRLLTWLNRPRAQHQATTTAVVAPSVAVSSHDESPAPAPPSSTTAPSAAPPAPAPTTTKSFASRFSSPFSRAASSTTTPAPVAVVGSDAAATTATTTTPAATPSPPVAAAVVTPEELNRPVQWSNTHYQPIGTLLLLNTDNSVLLDRIKYRQRIQAVRVLVSDIPTLFQSHSIHTYLASLLNIRCLIAPLERPIGTAPRRETSSAEPIIRASESLFCRPTIDEAHAMLESGTRMVCLVRGRNLRSLNYCHAMINGIAIRGLIMSLESHPPAKELPSTATDRSTTLPQQQQRQRQRSQSPAQSQLPPHQQPPNELLISGTSARHRWWFPSFMQLNNLDLLADTPDRHLDSSRSSQQYARFSIPLPAGDIESDAISLTIANDFVSSESRASIDFLQVRLIGPEGAGKTQLFSALAGIELAESTVAQVVPDPAHRAARRGMIRFVDPPGLQLQRYELESKRLMALLSSDRGPNLILLVHNLAHKIAWNRATNRPQFLDVIQCAKQHNIPVFLVLTNKHSVSSEKREAIVKQVAALYEIEAPRCFVVNSYPFQLDGTTKRPVEGIEELARAIERYYIGCIACIGWSLTTSSSPAVVR